MKAKGFLFVCAVIFLCVLGAFSVCAEEDMPDEYKDFISSIPDGTDELLPDGIYSDNPDEVADAVMEMSGLEYLLSAFFSTLGEGIGEVLPHGLVLVSVLIISAVGSMMSSHLSPSGARILDMLSHILLFASVGGISLDVLSKVKSFFSSLSGAITAFIPLSAALYSMGGNVGTAVKSGTGLLATLGIVEFMSGAVVVPLFCLCLCMSFISGLSPDIVGSSIGGGIKKAFLTTLGVITTILTLSLSTQNVIASKADNLAMRGMKMFLGGVPISGGSVSASLGTIVSGVEMIRGAVGIGGIIILVLLLLPVIIRIWLMKLLYSLLGSLSGMLGVPSGQKLFSEMSEAYGMLEGVCIMCTVVFVVAMAIMSMCMPAIS